MPRGLLETLGLAGTTLFAAPVALLGLDFLARGRLLQGLGFLAIAALMIVVPRRLTTPDDVPATAIERAVGAVVVEEEGETVRPGADDEVAAAGGEATGRETAGDDEASGDTDAAGGADGRDDVARE